MKKFLKENLLIFIYLAVAIIIELMGVVVTSGKFYIASPWLFFLILLLFVGVLFCLPSNRVRHIVSSVFLCVAMIVNLVFIVIFEMTETTFDYGMFKLRNDAMGILESIPINFLFFGICAFLISAYIVFGARYAKHNNYKFGNKYLKIVASISMVVVFSLNILVLYFGNRNFKKGIYERLYGTNDTSYNRLGITAHFVNEMFKGMFMAGVDLGNASELEEYFYKDVYESKFVDNEYNLVTVLVESFEWTSFIQDFELYVNGYSLKNPHTGEKYTDSEANMLLAELFPNIYDYYKSSIDLTNFYGREKTDIAENFCLLGSYPTDAYINYDFPNNEIVSSMPKILKTLTDSNIACNAFHNGTYNYYNRGEHLTNLGFDAFYATEQMVDFGMTNHQANGERNLDSEMIAVCKDKMFPTDTRFYSHITTITMHGQYSYRQNLADAGYYKELENYGITAMPANTKAEEALAFDYNNFYYYIACVKEFDKALGMIMSELETRGLKDNTIVMIYGDHNTYYSNLSNYVKDINNDDDDNRTQLYRVPCMIYHPDIETVISTINSECSSYVGTRFVVNDYTNSKGEPVKNIQVKKFTCTADILPTLLDLLGINYYTNFYYGHSVFNDTTSVLYSRAYNMFITDSVYFSSLKKIKWQREVGETKENTLASKYADLSGYTDKQAYMQYVEAEAKIILEKLDACNRAFYNDFFELKSVSNPEKTNAEVYKDKLKAIN